MVNNENPLVSIIVITYNSAKYVLETLESAKAQTYKNIELIISDDYSSDNTINLCQEWISKNEDRFVHTEIVTANKNTGIAPNCNRGIRSAKGEWIKLIAGDDILFDECIKINIDACYKTKLPFQFSKFRVKSEDLNIKNRIENNYENRYILFEGNQFDNLINKGYYFPTVTFFAKREEIIKLGLYNELYIFHEDLPLWFKILKSGYKFNFINDYTVEYRVHGNSMYTNKRYIINKRWHKSTKLFFYHEYIQELISRKKFLTIWDKIIHYLYIDVTIFFGNKKGIVDSICKLITLLSPLLIKNKLIKLSNLFLKTKLKK